MGAEPDRLLPHPEDLGLVDEFDEHDEERQALGGRFVEAALTLAERSTGLRLTPEQVRDPLLYATGNRR
ncbi:DUF6461 domain-containing protein [Nonomuraea wenchangensis]